MQVFDSTVDGTRCGRWRLGPKLCMVQELRHRFRAGICEPAVCNKVELCLRRNPRRGNFSSRFSSHLRWPCYVLVSDPQVGDARTELSLEGRQTPPTTSSGWKRMKTQILLEGAVGRLEALVGELRPRGGKSAGRSTGVQTFANCTIVASEGERFEHVCASLRTEWSSCAEYHGLFNVAMDMDLNSEVYVLLKEAAAIAAEGTMIEALDDDEAADDHMGLLCVFENQLKELET